MTQSDKNPSFPRWLAPVLVVMFALQLALTWLNGSLVHRQHADLQAIHAELHYITEALDQQVGDEPYEGDGDLSRMRWNPRHGFQRVRMQDDERARKDLDAARESALKAVQDSRDIQQKLSIEENARKAEETQKLKAAQDTWTPWIYVGLGAGLLALAVRAWIRRRSD